MMRMPLPQCIAAGLAALCFVAAAAPIVVFDSGRSVPLAPYVAQLVALPKKETAPDLNEDAYHP